MKVELANGQSAELRDKLKAKDKFKVQEAIQINMNGEISMSIITLMRTTLLTRLLTSWTLDAPLPGTHSCAECATSSALWHAHVAEYIGDTLDLEDYEALEAVIEPITDRIMDGPPNPGKPSSGSPGSS